MNSRTYRMLAYKLYALMPNINNTTRLNEWSRLCIGIADLFDNNNSWGFNREKFLNVCKRGSE